MRRFLARHLPRIGWNPVSGRNYERFCQLLLDASDHPRVLIVGGARVGNGLSFSLDDARVEWVESDIRRSDRTNLLCDAHNIPFEDGSFDGVVAQAVLEHVFDPYQVVSEFARVLKPGGAVYSETPFLQQVHAGARDFTRFTHLGHRRLFRNFVEVDSGPASGPGAAFAWACQAFVMSFLSGKLSRRIAAAVTRVGLFWLKYADLVLIKRPGAFDASAAYYFLGLKGGLLPDSQLLDNYRGAQV